MPSKPSLIKDIITKVIVAILTTLLLGAITFGGVQLKKVGELEIKVIALTTLIQNIPTADTQNLSTILHSLQEKSSRNASQIKMLLYILGTKRLLSQEEKSEILSAGNTD